MAERAQLFDENEDFDVSAFKPKTSPPAAAPPPEAVRAVSEGVNFRSREPAPPPKVPERKKRRGRRTGRNLQLNVKVAPATLQSFYEITDRHGWVLGETLERALAALQRELEKEVVLQFANSPS